MPTAIAQRDRRSNCRRQEVSQGEFEEYVVGLSIEILRLANEISKNNDYVSLKHREVDMYDGM